MPDTRKTVLITGCSAGGCGHALALEFAKRGLHVFATARDVSKMSQLADNPNITLLSLDITSAASIAEAVKTVTALTAATTGSPHGTLDYLVNNAGISQTMPVLDHDLPAGKALFDANVWGFLAVTQAFAPLVINAKGCICNICSIAGFLNSPWAGVYAASKAAMLVLGETLRLEMAPFEVGVNNVVTGGVATEIVRKGAGSDWRLPEGSLYQGAEGAIRRTGEGERTYKSMEPEEFARRAVGDCLGGREGLTWRGKMASTVRALLHGPMWFVDYMLAKDAGLEKVVPVATKA